MPLKNVGCFVKEKTSTQSSTCSSSKENNFSTSKYFDESIVQMTKTTRKRISVKKIPLASGFNVDVQHTVKLESRESGKSKRQRITKKEVHLLKEEEIFPANDVLKNSTNGLFTLEMLSNDSSELVPPKKSRKGVKKIPLATDSSISIVEGTSSKPKTNVQRARKLESKGPTKEIFNSKRHQRIKKEVQQQEDIFYPEIDVLEEQKPTSTQSGTNAIPDISTDNSPELLPAKKALKRVALQKAEQHISVQEDAEQGILLSLNELALRSKKMVGVHVSAAGGIWKAVYNAKRIGCKSFALFLKSQRSWKAKPLTETDIQKWNDAIEETGFSPEQIVPHGSYLLNAGSSEPGKLQNTRQLILDECNRCESLGIRLYNFHPGSSAGKFPKSECIKTIAETINYVHERTKSVNLLIETMAGSGFHVGASFSELAEIIKLVKDRTRVGVCFDTCHIFAAGYDIRTKKCYDLVMDDFDVTVGLGYIKAFHLNDSLGDLRSRVDRHANIGYGKLGLDAFRHLMKDPRFDGIPMVLETPEGQYEDEIKTLYEMEFC